MDMADHALARRYGGREDVFDGMAVFRFFAAAVCETAQDVSGLGSSPAEKRIEFGNHARGGGFFGRGHGRSLDRWRFPATMVALAKARVFSRVTAVVVERCAPE